MLETSYIEDVFLDFYDRCIEIWALSSSDAKVLNDFYYKITLNENFTQSQANYLLRLMSKHRLMAKQKGLDLDQHLADPKWRRPFRVLDQTKRIFVNVDGEKGTEIFMKFPYAFKSIFEKEMTPEFLKKSHWDADLKLRRLDIYDCNVVHLYEFVKEHGFEIDDSFLNIVSHAEEIWNQQEQIIPYSSTVDGRVTIHNACSQAEDFFNTHRSNDIQKDLFLAKQMGFVYRALGSPQTDSEKISSVESREFWFKDLDRFLTLHKILGGITVILLDRNTEDILNWLEKFIRCCDINQISRSEVKVCFRESDTKSSKLNRWIRENAVGGEVKDGKLLIFLHKPPKWIFKGQILIQMIGLNNFTPIAEPLSSSWIDCHHCVCYITDIRPTKYRNTEIVEL